MASAARVRRDGPGTRELIAATVLGAVTLALATAPWLRSSSDLLADPAVLGGRTAAAAAAARLLVWALA